MRLLKLGVVVLGATSVLLFTYYAATLRGRNQRQHRMVVGNERRSPGSGMYTLDFKTDVGPPGGAPFLSISLGGPILFREEEGQGDVVFRADFMGSLRYVNGLIASTSGDAPAGDVARAELFSALRSVFFLEYSLEGEFKGARMTAKGPAAATRLWQALGAALQLKASEAQSEWQASEMDAIGRYTASYHSLDGMVIEKRKRQYDSFNVSDVEYGSPDSVEQFTFASDGTLVSLLLREKIESKARGPIPAFGSSTEIRLVLANDQDVSRGEVGKALPYDVYALISPGQHVSDPRGSEIDTQKIGGRSLAKILEELSATSDNPTDPKVDREKKGRAYIALTAYIRQHPEDLKAVAEQILNNKALASSLIGALRDAGSPEAQRTMRDLLAADQGHLSSQLKALLVQGLSLVTSPTPETVGKLKDLQSNPEFAIQATYGLGSNAHYLSQSDPSLSQSIVDSLLERLKTTQNSGAQGTLLIALGAAGSPSALGTIESYTSDESDRVRSSSAQALRRIPGASADSLLAKLTVDSNDDVRYSAIDAISERQASSILEKAASEMALNDSKVKNRFKAVGLLGQWIGSFPEIRQVLQQLSSQTNQNQDLARLADRLIEAPSSKK